MNKTILCLFAGLFTLESLAQEIELSYKIDSKTIPISDNWYYDTEYKPKIFTLSVSNVSQEIESCIVDVYRTMYEPETEEVSSHYFGTFLLTRRGATKDGDGELEWEDAIDLSSIGTLNRARFLRTKGFEFEICLSSQTIAKVREKSECSRTESIRVIYGD